MSSFHAGVYNFGMSGLYSENLGALASIALQFDVMLRLGLRQIRNVSLTRTFHKIMVPLPYGPITKHIQCSGGPDFEKNRFYITKYSSSYGKESFEPRLGKHVGTGYQSNFRPQIFYSKLIDELDNPALGRSMERNYDSYNTLHYCPNQGGATGKEPIECNGYMTKSGFVKDRPQTLPTCRQVIDAYAGPSLPRKPILRNRDNLVGNAFMSTENHSQFTGQPNKLMNTSTRTIGPKEGSGFTHAYNNEPITYRPSNIFNGACRSYGGNIISAMKSSFTSAKSEENGKLLSKRAERDTGYTREVKASPEYASVEVFTRLDSLHSNVQKSTKKNDQAEYLNMLHCAPYVSTTKFTFRGSQPNPMAISTGGKEQTGYTENNCRFVETCETNDSLHRFNTHYQLRFDDKNARSLPAKLPNAREKINNGFTKSTQVHSYRVNNCTKEPFNMHPYVSRSRTAREPCYTTTDVTKVVFRK